MSKLTKVKDFLLRNNNTSQIVIKNTFWLTVSQLGSRLVRALIIIYAARVLGAEEYGAFSYALGLAGFLTVFSDLGLSSIMARETAKEPGMREKYFGTGLILKGGLLILVGIVVILFAPYLSNIKGVEVLVPLIALLLFLDGLRDFSLSYVRGLEKMELEALINMITNVAITIFGFIILGLSDTAYALTISYVGSVGVGTLSAILILQHEFKHIIKNFDKSLMRPIIVAALPVTILMSFGPLLLNLNIVMLGWLKNAHDIGLYSAAQRIVQVLYTLPIILASTLYPATARLIGAKEELKIKTLIEQGMKTIMMIAIPLTIGGVLLSSPIIHFIFGAEFRGSEQTFQILMISILAAFPGLLIGNTIIAYNKQKNIIPSAIYACLANIILNMALIPSLGILGSAIATLIAQVFYNARNWMILRKLSDFSVLPHLKNIIVASIGMTAILLLLDMLHVHLILIITISSLIYFGILVLLKEPVLENLNPKKLFRS